MLTKSKILLGNYIGVYYSCTFFLRYKIVKPLKSCFSMMLKRSSDRT